MQAHDEPTLVQSVERSQRFEYLPLLGKASFLVLREDLPVIRCNVEDAVSPFDQLRLHAELVPDCGRQTGGSRKVVSNDAIFDCQMHVSSPFECLCWPR